MSDAGAQERALGAAKEYPTPRVKVAAFMVENVQWARIRKRVGEAEGAHAPEWLLGVATLAAGVAASAVIAYIALPHATDPTPKDISGDVIAAGTRPTLIATFLAGSVLAAVFGLLYQRERKKHAGRRSDIQDEMDTIKTAWEESSGRSTTVDGAEVR